MRSIPYILTLAVAAFGCQAATVTGPGWGEIPEGPSDGVDDPGPGGDEVTPIDEGADPQQVFLEQVLPLIDLRCADCHTNVVTGPVFIDLANPYETILSSGVITIGDPGASSLVTKGAHRGPAWQPDEARVVSEWIRLEAGPPGGGNPGGGGGGGGEEEPEPDPGVDPVVGDYETSPQAVVDGDNVIELDDVGLPGAELHFFAQRVALGLHISSVTVYAGGEALVINHPTFITHVPGGESTPDPEDRFASLELVVPADGAALLADNVLLVDFPTDGELSISFVSAGTL